MTPQQTTTRLDRCANTGLGKPECHCRDCVQAMIATYAPHLRPAGPRPPAAPDWSRR